MPLLPGSSVLGEMKHTLERSSFAREYAHPVITRDVAVGLVLAGALSIVNAAPAFASTATGTLAGGFGAGSSQSVSSSCPTGAVVTGLQVSQERRGFVSVV